MTLTQVWGALLLLIVCPLLGGLPLIRWLVQGMSGQKLAQIGTGNLSVSAAFYHGGRWLGMMAVLSEALKGIAAVLLARSFFPTDPVWELVALMAVVMGRYWVGRSAGTTNVVWGYVAHDPITAGFVFLIGGISFTVLRERKQGKFGILVLFPLITALRHPYEPELGVAAIALAGLLGWIYTQIPDDLEMNSQTAQPGAQSMFRFFRGDRAIPTLDQSLDPSKVGQKTATLAQLRRLGYPVLPGWALLPGDDLKPLIEWLDPTPESPFIVRSSAIGEDSEQASAAGQYASILNVTSRAALQAAIIQCFAAYDAPAAAQYRRDRQLPESSMTVLVQPQIAGVFSGVAFSRDPISRQGDAVVIEALPGDARQIVSGEVTPESYRVWIQASEMPTAPGDWQLPQTQQLAIEGSGDLPPRLIQQVAFLARHLESHYHGIPQDIEWSYDGETLWLLQARPITTLLPIWTRKIAAEVIPGLIHPLTWSINRPLTCGVWGDLFAIVLAKRAQGLAFNETATLHFSRAYFNATLLGKIFRRMGLPPESLEFLTIGAKFSQPPLWSTLRNLPGLLRLAQREWHLETDFQRHYQHQFLPALDELARQPGTQLSNPALLMRIERILQLLRTATYYSILAPLSAALRKAILKLPDEQIDASDTPEVAALRSLQALALAAHQVLIAHQQDPMTAADPAALLALLSQMPPGQAILQQFEQFLDRYGYLSEVGTDIAIPTWREDPRSVQALFMQFCQAPPIAPVCPQLLTRKGRWVQQRFALRGKVTEVYSRLLAELRWSFLALEQQWLASGTLHQANDIFFLEWDEIRQQVSQPLAPLALQARIAQRRSQLETDRALETIPFLVYGQDPPFPAIAVSRQPAVQQLRGIGASPGQVEGQIRVVRSLSAMPTITQETILVVPYTDSGWAPLLARAGGLIAEVGGRLSHGAIVAREYRIPAVMNIPQATQVLQDGQRVRLDGQQGTIDLL